MRKKKNYTYKDLIEMGERYQVDTNPLFAMAAAQYETQQAVIRSIQKELEEGTMTIMKTYVKGSENMCVNPLIRELPKHSDSANKTLSTMLDIILKLGHEKQEESALEKFTKQYE